MANVDNIDDALRWSSNVSDGDAFYPALDALSNAQILVTTLVVAGRLAQATLSKSYPEHFDYVFIDECASTDEPSALIPIACVCSAKNTLTAHVVLAGDPYQLRAIVSSQLAKNVGYGTLINCMQSHILCIYLYYIYCLQMCR